MYQKVILASRYDYSCEGEQSERIANAPRTGVWALSMSASLKALLPQSEVTSFAGAVSIHFTPQSPSLTT